MLLKEINRDYNDNRSKNHHLHWLDSPAWALAFFKSFLYSSLFNIKFLKFLSPKILMS
jgi:hypothetical protein